MRGTRVEVLHERREIPLVVRARFEKTFFGLGAFAAMFLLLVGGYLMTEAMIDPIGASDMGVLAAGFALALSSFLLVYFAWPRGRLELAKRESAREEDAWKNPVLTVYGDAVHTRVITKKALGEDKGLPGPMWSGDVNCWGVPVDSAVREGGGDGVHVRQSRRPGRER